MIEAGSELEKWPENDIAAQDAERMKQMNQLTFRIDNLPSVGNFKHTTDLLTGAPFVAQFALIRLVRGAADVGDIAPKHLEQADWGAAYAASLLKPHAPELADELALMDATAYPTLAQFEATQKRGVSFGWVDGARSDFDRDMIIYGE